MFLLIPLPPDLPRHPVAAVLHRVRQILTARLAWDRARAPLLLLLHQRLGRLTLALARLAAAHAAGTLADRPTGPRPRRHPAATKPEEPPRPRIPRRRGWLTALEPHCIPYAGLLHGLIGQPEMQALIAAAPLRTARLVNPLCRMLGADPIPVPKPDRPALPKPRRKPRPPRTPDPPEFAAQLRWLRRIRRASERRHGPWHGPWPPTEKPA